MSAWQNISKVSQIYQKFVYWHKTGEVHNEIICDDENKCISFCFAEFKTHFRLVHRMSFFPLISKTLLYFKEELIQIRNDELLRCFQTFIPKHIFLQNIFH